MPKTVKMKLAGATYDMPASYKVAREISQEVGDPLKMAMAAERGDIPFGFDDVVGIIYIGCKAAGCGLSRDDVGDEVMEAGFTKSLETAAELIGFIVAGGPAKPVKAGGGKKSKAG